MTETSDYLFDFLKGFEGDAFDFHLYEFLDELVTTRAQNAALLDAAKEALEHISYENMTQEHYPDSGDECEDKLRAAIELCEGNKK